MERIQGDPGPLATNTPRAAAARPASAPALQPHTTAARDRLALDLALEHAALSTNPRILCAAAQACQAWQHAVQQCGSCNTAVVLDPQVPLQQVCSFRRWLLKHAGLVKSLTAKAQQRAPYGQDRLQWQCQLEAVQALLQQAMELAAWKPAAAATAAAPTTSPALESCQAVEAQQQQQQQQLLRRPQGLLRLASFSSNLPGAPSMLAALSARHLTYLDLTLQYSCSTADGPWLAAALPQLTSLQQLRLNGWLYPCRIPGSCLAGISQLTRLTSLEISEAFKDIEQPLQLVLAQPLPLRTLRLQFLWDYPVLDLSALTQLEDLTAAMLPGQTVLPLQLQHLHATNRVECDVLAAVTPLQQLRTLSIWVDFEQQQPLLRLAQLPALQHLNLRYHEVQHAAGTAAAWPQLPQLQALEVWWEAMVEDFPDEQQLAVIWASALACIGLTKLALGADNGAYDSDGVAVCAALARLTRLKDLTICSGTSLVPGDAQALTALTGLTRLVLSGVGGVEEADIVASAHSMPHLRHLELGWLDLSGMACLAAVGKLTQLTELCLANSDGTTEQSLMQLTGLVHLQKFTAGRSVTDEAVDRFWAAVQKQRELLQQ